MKNWKCKVVMFVIGLIILRLLIIAFDDYLLIIKGYLFAVILIVAGYIDIKTRKIPNWIHVLIIVVGMINIDLFQSVVGIVVVPLPFLIMACFKENSIGGGDIKLIGACGFFLGVSGGLIGSVIGLGVAVVVNGLYYALKKRSKNIGFALAPYLGFGSYLSFILFLI